MHRNARWINRIVFGCFMLVFVVMFVLIGIQSHTTHKLNSAVNQIQAQQELIKEQQNQIANVADTACKNRQALTNSVRGLVLQFLPPNSVDPRVQNIKDYVERELPPFACPTIQRFK
jgi:hypothetical protein